MATYEVTGPDGGTYEITAPDGASEADVMSYAQSNYQGAAAPAAAPTNQYEGKEESALQDFGEGLGVSALNTWEGGKDLLSKTGLVDAPDASDLARLQDWKDDAGQSGWGTGGEIVGDVAQILAGGGLGGAALKGATMIPKALKGAVAMDTAAAGLLGGTQTQGGIDERLGGAADEAKLALLGGALGKLGGKVVGGMSRSEAGDALIKKGVQLTPAQALTSPVPKSLDYLMGVTPFIAKGVQNAKDRATASFNKVALDEANLAGAAPITEAGQKGIAQLDDNFNAAYSKAWDGANAPVAKTIADMADEATDIGLALGGNGSVVLKGIAKDLVSLEQSSLPNKALKLLDTKLRKKISSASKNGEEGLKETLESLREQLRTSAGADVAKELARVDAGYGKYAAIRAGASAAAPREAGGVMSPSQLMAGDKIASLSKLAKATGGGGMYDFAKQGVDTIGQKTPNPIMDFMRGWAVNLPPVLPLQMMGNQLTGTGTLQKFVQKGTNSPLADALRKYGVRGSAGGGQTLSNSQD